MSNGTNGVVPGFEHGVQVINEEKEFNTDLSQYLKDGDIFDAGFNYHLISVFGSQSTGKSTLLNHLFGTEFSVMSESQRRQTTKGIWLAKNRNQDAGAERMADNILVMDVEGTDGRERGEDQDFERKSALFALATSEVLIVNLWEHQVGLYQGANMGLLKTVFEVNLQIFLKDKQSTPRSLLFFVIRDHIGATPLSNLRDTLIQDLTHIWTSISKPQGLENSRIEDYFDFGFAALPHKLLQGDKFVSEVRKLGCRFRPGNTSDKLASPENHEFEGGLFLPEYHRRIPADGFAHYAGGIWDTIVDNKDLDLPTQQELLAQFRCDEIAREALAGFDARVTPLEEDQTEAVRSGKDLVIEGLGDIGRSARDKCLTTFETQAGRYHKGVYTRKKQELAEKIDTRLRALFINQIQAAHRIGITKFSQAVQDAVKSGQKAGGIYEFADIVAKAKNEAIANFNKETASLLIEGVEWTTFTSQERTFQSSVDSTSKSLRKEEMRRLATRVERWVKSRLGDSIGLEFSKIAAGKSGAALSGSSQSVSEHDLWDRVWEAFVDIVKEAEGRFADRAKSFDASPEEAEAGLWKLRRKSWMTLRQRIDELLESDKILSTLRESFEDKFRYDESGVPRIWRPSDDIEGIYVRASNSTQCLIPILSRFTLSSTEAPPDLPAWIGAQPAGADDHDDDLLPIGGVDDDGKSLEEEMTMLSENKKQDLLVRFKKMADGVFVEAKRGAIGGIAQVPWYFYILLVALGWNELFAVLRNPMLALFTVMVIGGAYLAHTLHMLGPMARMGSAAVNQGVDIAKANLREFLENSDAARKAVGMPTKERNDSAISLDTLDTRGRKVRDDTDEI